MSHTNLDYSKELNAEQLVVVEQADGAALVLAGAGSGKTRTIVYRVTKLLESGVEPEGILLLTFTNKAASEMLSRVGGLLARTGKTVAATRICGGTFHSVCARLLRQHAGVFGFTSDFTILDAEDSRDMMKRAISSIGAPDTGAKKFPSAAVLQAWVSFGRNSGMAVREVVAKRHASAMPYVSIIERIAERYTHDKRVSNAMDFDDLLLFFRQLLWQEERVRAALARQFRYVIVDEYQDTNIIQADIVRALASHHGNLLVVGDDAQSIYSFRAADIANILEFPKQFPNVKVFHLNTNYRSVKPILKLANAVIEQNEKQFQKELVAVREGVQKPTLRPETSATAEAKTITQMLRKAHNEGTPWSEMAVLFRASFHAQTLEFTMVQEGIPYDYRGGLKFFERAHIKDVLAFLRVIANPKDITAWQRMLLLYPGMGKVTVDKLLEQIVVQKDLQEICSFTPACSAKAMIGWERLRQLIKAQDPATPLGGWIRAYLQGGYSTYVQAEFVDATDRLEDIEQLIRFAENYKEIPTFLQEISLAEQQSAPHGKGQEQKDAVVLSTIHQAKGLEWDRVFLIHLLDGKFPNEKAVEEGALEEERRLFYVAVTRARTHLHLSYPLRTGGDAMDICLPSPFLDELPSGLLQEEEVASAGGGWGFRRPSSKPSFSDDAFFDEGPVIVLNEMGERSETTKNVKTGLKPVSTRRSFLMDV